MQSRRGLELDLRKALVLEQFELFYQPLINIKTGEITTCEALLRWRHPERGLVPPADFIPLAEEIGFINQLGAWVLKQGCIEAMRWPKEIKVSINLSPVQFKTGTLVSDVESALRESGLLAHRLELEITESVLLAETEATLATLNKLHDIGAQISMDDFGTGYSSLGYLRKFPFDKIKIDQSFVRDLTDKPDSVAIIQRSPASPIRWASRRRRKESRRRPNSNRSRRKAVPKRRVSSSAGPCQPKRFCTFSRGLLQVMMRLHRSVGWARTPAPRSGRILRGVDDDLGVVRQPAKLCRSIRRDRRPGRLLGAQNWPPQTLDRTLSIQTARTFGKSRACTLLRVVAALHHGGAAHRRVAGAGHNHRRGNDRGIGRDRLFHYRDSVRDVTRCTPRVCAWPSRALVSTGSCPAGSRLIRWNRLSEAAAG